MKRFFSFLFACILCFSLCGCSFSSITKADAEELNLYVFTMEYGQLYAYNPETGTNTLLLENYICAYDRMENSVIASTTDGDVYEINLKTYESTLLVEKLSDIGSFTKIKCLKNGFIGLVFTMTEGVRAYRYLYKDKTYEQVNISENSWQIAVINDVIYYTDYIQEDEVYSLYALDASAKELGDPDELYRSANYLSLAQGDNSVYLSEENVGWYQLNIENFNLENSPLSMEPNDTLLYANGDTAIYNRYIYDEISGEHFYYEKSGNIQEMSFLQGYMQCCGVVNGIALLECDDYLNDTEDHYYMRTTWYLFDLENGTPSEVNLLSENTKLFASGDFPVMDSSTARQPVTQSIYDLFCTTPGIDGTAPLCSTTHGAWTNIADGIADIALLAAPTEEELAYLEEKGIDIEMKLYGGDGLVFIGNTTCGVDNLTLDQIRSIYLGEITNWSELGGVDHDITVYYRDDQSGSQRLFEKLLFKDRTLPTYSGNQYYLEDEMTSIVDACLYDPYAIGYSIMTYLNDVYCEANLLVFNLEGVSVSTAHVADGTYPLSTKGYVVIRSDELEGSPARRLYDWFGSSTSDYILTMNSIFPIHEYN